MRPQTRSCLCSISNIGLCPGAGRQQQTLGEIQVAHGVTKDVSEKQLAEWQAREHKADPIHK